MFEPAHFLISCSLPHLEQEEDSQVALAQEVAVDRMLLAGQLLQYAVSEDEGRWWAILTAQTEWHVRQLAATLPWCMVDELKVTELSFFACNETQGFSLN
ncbi:MAG: hypothetical protein AAFY48_08305 [Bacteroidota bacterium]